MAPYPYVGLLYGEVLRQASLPSQTGEDYVRPCRRTTSVPAGSARLRDQRLELQKLALLHDPLGYYSGWKLSAQMIILIDELLLMCSRSTLLNLPQHLEQRFGNMMMQLILMCKKYDNAVSLEDVDFAAVRSRIMIW